MTDSRRTPWGLLHARGPDVASMLRRWGISLTHAHCDVRFAEGVRLGAGFSLHIPHAAAFEVGPEASFGRHFHCELDREARVSIGARTRFGPVNLIQCSTVIEIGSDCLVDQATLIVNGQHQYSDHQRDFLDQDYNVRTITIGDGARIGAKCTVMADVGERAVIAPNSAVTRDIPAFCIARGAPARVVDYFGPEERRPAELRA